MGDESKRASLSSPEPIQIATVLEREAKVTLGVATDGRIILTVDGKTLAMSPELADEISADLRRCAIEAREGGAQG